MSLNWMGGKTTTQVYQRTSVLEQTPRLVHIDPLVAGSMLLSP